MKERNLEVIKTSMKVGAVLGGLVFLIFGIVPGFHFGGTGTVMLLSKLTGGPLEFTLFVRAIVVLGILVGIFCLGTLSIVLGSVFGTLSGVLISALTSLRVREEKEQVVRH